MMLGDLETALGLIRPCLRLEPEKVAAADAAKLFDLFLEIEKAGLAGKTLFAGRAAAAGLWREQGHRSPAAWMAEAAGTGPVEANGTLEMSERLQSLPETTEALRRGELSAPQLREITATACAVPSSERELLAAAGRHGLKGLKDHCARVKARATSEADASARDEQIRKNRSVIMWMGHDGVGRVEARLTPDAFGRFKTAVEREANAVFCEARRAGRRERTEAYQADALLALVTGTASTAGTAGTGSSRGSRPGAGGKTAAPSTTMHLRVDVAALRRGRLEDGEVCEIPGVGPVPLATARNAIGDAVLKVIVTDGVDVRAVANMKRAIPARLRRALEERDPTCVVPGCDVARGLENDHYQIDFIKDGPTEMWNLCRLCRWHHYLKTHCGYAITGGPGEWEWQAPASETNPVLTS
jgi:hypothetical protein